MKRRFSNHGTAEPTADALERAAIPASPSGPGAAPPLNEDERTEFARRLESFGLGARQSPLLTDCIWSLDVDGNLR